jgi:hypothetical protein
MIDRSSPFLAFFGQSGSTHSIRANPIFNWPTVRIVAFVGSGRYKLGDQVTGSAVEFHQIKSGFFHA